ncbi:unnamed protein product [Cylicocyclus nassatus]|uniref:Uncharacterized protein n=1 Tax=Cylicocyclus nassatus TaxID=53992 RepID=A0AA36M7X6_CYLNA|nr:unnamed protein product [Cylicocyclus nassatus]
MSCVVVSTELNRGVLRYTGIAQFIYCHLVAEVLVKTESTVVYHNSVRWETSTAIITEVYKPPTRKDLIRTSVTLQMFSPNGCVHDDFPALTIPTRILVGGRLDLSSRTISMDACEFKTWKKGVTKMFDFKDTINCSTVPGARIYPSDSAANSREEIREFIVNFAVETECIKLELWKVWCPSPAIFNANISVGTLETVEEDGRADILNLPVTAYLVTFAKVYTGEPKVKVGLVYSVWLIGEQRRSKKKLVKGNTIAGVFIESHNSIIAVLECNVWEDEVIAETLQAGEQNSRKVCGSQKAKVTNEKPR